MRLSPIVPEQIDSPQFTLTSSSANDIHFQILRKHIQIDDIQFEVLPQRALIVMMLVLQDVAFSFGAIFPEQIVKEERSAEGFERRFARITGLPGGQIEGVRQGQPPVSRSYRDVECLLA
jgi:hypothetical protein